MKPFETNSPRIRSNKSPVSVVGVAVAEANVGVAVSVVSSVFRAAAEVVVVEEANRIKVLKVASRSHRARSSPITLIQDTRLRDILITLHSSPASGTGLTESQLISVWSQGHDLGRTSGPLSPTNETSTSLTIIMTTVNFTTCCLVTNYRKYTQ